MFELCLRQYSFPSKFTAETACRYKSALLVMECRPTVLQIWHSENSLHPAAAKWQGIQTLKFDSP